MPRIRVGDLDVACDRAGQGKPLVLLHPAFLDRHVWDRVVPDLSARFDTWVPDLPGHGESPAPEDWDHDMMKFLEGWLEAAGIGSAHWVGSSFGGGLIIRLGAKNPGIVRSMVLSAPTGIPKREMDEVRAKHSKARSTWEAFREAFEDPALATKERYHEYARLQRVAAPFFRRYRETHPEDYDEVGWVPQMRAIQAPTLLIWGDQDRTIPPPMDRRTNEEIPGSELSVWKGAKHFPFLDRPSDFARAVIDFIESRP